MSVPTYLFDGHCVLCSRGVQYALKYETRPDVRFVAIQSKEGRRLALANNVDPDEPHTALYIDGTGRAHEKSDAVIALTRTVGGPGRMLLAAKVLPRRFRDFIYDKVAASRYSIFGKTDTCYLPPPDMRSRFTLPGD
ncbi:MAG: DCC1-like thiol-disulfide oxidoreductase family protein [Pseudomonadota bacterium]